MQEEVILSSFDRRGGRPPLDGGYWDVSTPDQGAYQIKVQFARKKEAASLHLCYAGLHWQKAVSSNTNEVIFEHIILPQANDRFCRYFSNPDVYTKAWTMWRLAGKINYLNYEELERIT